MSAIRDVERLLLENEWRPRPELQPPPGGWKLRIAEPDLGGGDSASVMRALHKDWISGTSPIVHEAEDKFAAFCGTKHAVACNSGGSALHLLMRALDYPPGSEVIVPSFTMIATAAAVSLAGCVPVFVDCEPEHLTIPPDVVARAIAPQTRAVVAVHMYGHPCDTEGIQKVIDDVPNSFNANIDLLEDAAEAAGAKVWTSNDHVRGRPCGSLGHAAAFSFYANKVLAAGEGGMITTDDDRIADRVHLLRAHGDTGGYWHVEIGHSMRMHGLAAALLCAQLGRSDDLIVARQRQADSYNEFLDDGVTRSTCEASCLSSWWHFWVRVPNRAKVRAELASLGYETRTGFVPMHVQPCYQDRISLTQSRGGFRKWPSRSLPCPESERAGREVLLLPTHRGVTKEHVREMCEVINRESK